MRASSCLNQITWKVQSGTAAATIDAACVCLCVVARVVAAAADAAFIVLALERCVYRRCRCRRCRRRRRLRLRRCRRLASIFSSLLSDACQRFNGGKLHAVSFIAGAHARRTLAAPTLWLGWQVNDCVDTRARALASELQIGSAGPQHISLARLSQCVCVCARLTRSEQKRGAFG